MTSWVSNSVLISHEIGLHARPSVRLTKLAKSFKSHIEIMPSSSEDWVNAKSIVKVMALRAMTGSELNVRAKGSDSEAAVTAIVSLVQRNFDEEQLDAKAS